MCRYNTPLYWEKALLDNRDVWRSSFPDGRPKGHPLFINTTLINYGSSVLDNNWASHDEPCSILGFLQYIYLPFVFYDVVHDGNASLIIPIDSTQNYLAWLKEKAPQHFEDMRSQFNQIMALWESEPSSKLSRMKAFCTEFSRFWTTSRRIVHVAVFETPYEIADSLLAQIAFPEVLKEEIGMTPQQLNTLCEDYYRDAFIRRNFVSILNNKIGCIV